MKKNQISPGRTLLRTVANEKHAEIVFDVAEIALDENLTEGILKEIPIVGALVKIVHASQSISEELFVRKLLRFLSELQDVPTEQRQKLLEQYPDSSEEQRVLGENLLLALERLDDVEKPIILARFFKSYIRSEIDYTTFFRLARALERFNLALFPNLRWFYSREEPRVDTPEEIIHELSLAGLVIPSIAGSGAINGSASYKQSTLGKTFINIGFKAHLD